jgi:translation initiation factor IF-2
MAHNQQDTHNDKHFPPVVSVLGHVDHGKTTLLDAIRKTGVAEREHGGITQKIGASEVETVHEGQKRRITFIDTPGHEAFAKMRGRGAKAADIGILVVSSADGIMPQTKESIELLQKANVPYIVALTKSDLPTKIPEQVKQQLVGAGVMLEGLGGDIPVIEVSARTNHNIKELLDLILLVHDLHQPNPDEVAPQKSLLGIIIESKLDPKSGPRATVVVKNGKIQVREEVFSGGKSFKVRSLLNTFGKQVKEATIGDAVEVLGFTDVPPVGSSLTSTSSEIMVEKHIEKTYSPMAPEGALSVILCVDSFGSLEAILAALPKDIIVISSKTGDVTESDILLAKSTGGIVLGFNVKIRPDVLRLAVTEKVLVRNYSIIYEMLDELSDVLEGKRLESEEQIYGTAKIMASFPFEKTLALGLRVEDGRIAKGDKVRIMRGDDVVGETTIASLRVGKEPTSKIEAGNEAGAVLASKLDFRVGDMLISHA